MWKPPQRIRHPLPEARWPSREEAEASRWFSPLQLGPVTLEQRTWVPAMVPWRATEDGEVTEEVIAWYERFAQGRPGALVVEATGIRDVPSGPLLRIGHDRFIPHCRRGDIQHHLHGGESDVKAPQRDGRVPHARREPITGVVTPLRTRRRRLPIVCVDQEPLARNSRLVPVWSPCRCVLSTKSTGRPVASMAMPLASSSMIS